MLRQRLRRMNCWLDRQTDEIYHIEKSFKRVFLKISGNRTWVMTDFDRHIIKVWRPNGSAVIFGDRFIEDKKRLGFSLCSYCGMLEQQVGQFTADQKQRRYCSQKCLDAALANTDNT